MPGLPNARKGVLERFYPHPWTWTGLKTGYDIPLTKAMSEMLDIPVIASGGVGNPGHIYGAFKYGKADAALAASIFHFNEYPVPMVKEYLKQKDVPVSV